MTEERERIVETHGGAPGWVTPAVILLGILALAGLGFGWTATNRANETQQTLSANIKTLQQDYERNVTTIQQRLSEAEKSTGELQSDLGVVTKRLRVTQGELKKARQEAAQIREDSAKQIADMSTQVNGQLATKASTEEVKAVSGEVTTVRTDLDSTKKDLQMAKGEFGTLIARNHEEIDQLRRMGQRDYVEFTLDGKGKPQKVSNVTLELRAANPKKNQFSLAMVVEDKRVEKRNRTINEPIYFYTGGSRQPWEIVINQVSKNKVVGYLSMPKYSQAAASGD